MVHRTWSVRDVKNRFSEFVAAARRRPQTVTKRGRPVVVVVDVTEYERLRRLDQAQSTSFVGLLLELPQDDGDFTHIKLRPRDLASRSTRKRRR